MELPLISVVVPVRNEEPFIERTLRALLTQDYPQDRLEVIVVDGMSDDDTAAVVHQLRQSFSNLALYLNPAQVSSAARNIGVAKSSGDIVLFVDGHVHIDNDQILGNTARLMYDKDVSVLSRPQFLETPGNTPLQNAIALARRSRLGHGLDSTIYLDRDAFVDPASSGAAYRRLVFDTVGPFDETFDASEDYEFNFRVQKAGYKSFSSPSLSIHYYPRSTIRALFRQMYRYGLGRCRLARKHPSTLSLPSITPAALTLLLALLPVSFATNYLFEPIALIALTYVMLVLLYSLGIGLGKDEAHLLRLLLVFPTIHIGLGIGFVAGLLEAVTGRRFS